MAAENEPRMTLQTIKVLGVFLEDPHGNTAGSDIRKKTKLMSGTYYPILLRLEKAGWLTSKWEEIDPHEEGRPRKRFYRLTPLGQRRAQAVQAEVVGALGA